MPSFSKNEVVLVRARVHERGLVASYSYNEQIARAVSVHSSAIREALHKFYSAPELAEQLGR